MKDQYNYTPDSEGYQSNGHYKIEGTDYMSVWTYKETFLHGLKNSKAENALVTMEMDAKFGLAPFKCIMEVGAMKGEFVQLHRVEDLKLHLPKPKFRIGKG